MQSRLRLEIRRKIIGLCRVIREPDTKRQKLIWRRREAYADCYMDNFRNRFEKRVQRMKGQPKLQMLMEKKLKRILKNIGKKKMVMEL